MVLHAIVLQEANEEVFARVEEKYRLNYPVSDKCLLVRSDDISERIAANVGLKGDTRIEGAAGAVFKLNGAYAGYASSGLWEWLALEERR